MKMIIGLLFLLFTLPATAMETPGHGGGHEGHSAGAQLQLGHYVGVLNIGQRNLNIAVTADFLIEDTDDFNQFPSLRAIIKESLGGYNTNEYVTQAFQNVRYDFDRNKLNLDEPSTDLVITAAVHMMSGKLHVMGTVFIRSSAMTGTIDLEFQNQEPGEDLSTSSSEPGSNEPGDGEPGSDPSSSNLPRFIPLLQGQYTGLCNGQPSVFQLQTLKGTRTAGGTQEIFDYEISARIGYRETNSKDRDRPWTVTGSFSGGSYNFYTGKLFFSGPSSAAVSCTLTQDKMSCRRQLQNAAELCEFKKDEITQKPPRTYTRKFHLTPQAEQLRELPDPAPPANSELTRGLEGVYRGYLHHEATGQYQIVELQVVPSTSSENPHNVNKVFISTTSLLHFGNTLSGDFVPARYEPRSFYVRPGFTLNAPGTDSLISIEAWKQGYISGVWFSNSFGRVGTVELVKGDLPSIPAEASLIPAWTGAFVGAPLSKAGRSGAHGVNLELPNQVAAGAESTIPLSGSFQIITGVTSILPLERGHLDLYTGALGWVMSANGGETLITGNCTAEGQFSLFWPPLPNVFGVSMADYKPEIFKRVDSRN